MNDETQIWYGLCTYWTDDWDALTPTPENKHSRVSATAKPPCCSCGSRGIQRRNNEKNRDRHGPGDPGFVGYC